MVNHNFISQFGKLKGHIVSKEFIGFDCETYTNKNLFRCCSFVASNWRKTFWNKREAIEFIFNHKRTFQKKYIVATNLEFDIVALFLGEPEWDNLKLLFGKMNLIAVKIEEDKKIKNKNGDIVFIDTLNYNKRSVKELGELININKLEISEDFFKKEKLTIEEQKELMEYNINDALISKKYMEHLQNTINNLGGNIKLTLPSTALDLFRRKYFYYSFIKESKIYGDDTITDFIFASYYGGRTENFVKGIYDNVYYYDVNSLYPSVMIDNFYPEPSSVFIPEKLSKENIYDYMGVTECKIKAPNDNIPILPSRYNGKTIFPIGEFKGIWTNELLTYALYNGYEIIEIYEQVLYNEKVLLFHDYIDKLYNLRLKYKEEKNPEEQTIKLLLNSLYGKFGQRKPLITELVTKEKITNSLLQKKLLAGYEIHQSDITKMYIMQIIGKKYSKNTFPIIASYVTSYALIQMCIKLKNTIPLYIDTDSIMTQIEIKENINNNLGGLKIEKIGFVNINAPKCYMFNDSPIIKGINMRKLKPEEKIQVFNDYIEGKKIIQERFMKIKSGLRSINYIPNEIIEFTKSKKIDCEEKRIFNKNGLSIPIKLEFNKNIEVIL